MIVMPGDIMRLTLDLQAANKADAEAQLVGGKSYEQIREQLTGELISNTVAVGWLPPVPMETEPID